MLDKIPSSIAHAVTEAMKLVEKLQKGDNNKFQNYKYTSIDDFLEDLRPKLAETGLVIASDETDATHFKMPELKKDGTIQDSAFVHYSYDFYLGNSDSLESYGPLRRSVDIRFVGPQTSGQAQSYAEKMFLRSLLKVATGEKDADDQEQGDFKAGIGAPGNKRTGNKVIDKAVNDALQAIKNCLDKESTVTVGRHQYKTLKEGGATEDQLTLIQQQVENHTDYLSARGQ